MKRGVLAAGVVALVAVAAIAWLSVNYVTQGRRAHDLQRNLSSLETKHRQLNLNKQHAQRKLEDEISALERSLRRQERRLEDERHLVGDLRRRLKPLRRLGSLLTLPRATVDQIRMVPAAGGGTLAVVAWRKGDESFPRRSGVSIWRTDIDARSSAIRATDWSLAYSVHLKPPTEDGTRVVRVGQPARERVEDASGQEFYWFRTGDVTGEGERDILLISGNFGTGGCRDTRVLINEPNSLRQIFHRATCEGGVFIGERTLRIEYPTFPQGCESVHGCGLRFSVLRWNGSSWIHVRAGQVSRS